MKRARKLSFLEDLGSTSPYQSLRVQERVSGHVPQAESLNLFDQKLRDAEAETSEDDEENEGEPHKVQVPRRSTRHKATKKANTPVFTSSGYEDDEDDDQDPFRRTPTKKGPGRPRKQPTAPKLQGKFSIDIPILTASSSLARDEYEAVPEPEDMPDDGGFLDFGDIELGEDVEQQPSASKGDPLSKRKSETQPKELDPRPVKRRHSKKVSKLLSNLELNSCKLVDDSEEEQDEEQVRFLTGPYHEPNLRHPVPQSLPSVPTTLGLADAIKQISSKRPAAGASQHAVLKVKAMQDLKKVKRSMLDQVDWLEKDDPGHWLRDPLDCWSRTIK